MSLTLGLSTALSGLSASRRGVDLVSNNIANVNTPGFSRKFFNPKSRVLDGRGVGVEVAEQRGGSMNGYENLYGKLQVLSRNWKLSNSILIVSKTSSENRGTTQASLMPSMNYLYSLSRPQSA